MSATDAALLARVDALLAKGQAVAATEHSSGSVRMVEWGVYQEWRTQSLSALVAVVGANHAYPAEFARIINSNSPVTVTGGMGILRALREDIANGYLRRLEALVSADVFTDFLDMAQHLLDTDYKDPAASLTGAVLEDGLRRIATAKGNYGDSALNQTCLRRIASARLGAALGRPQRPPRELLQPRDEGLAPDRSPDAFGGAQALDRIAVRRFLEKRPERREPLQHGGERRQPIIAAGQVRPHARPAPVLRPRHQARPHRIERDVAHRRRQVLLVHHHRAEAALPEMPAALAAGLQNAGVAPVGRRQGAAQSVGISGNQDQVHVIGHQAPGPDFDLGRAAILGQEIAIERVVVVIEERPRPPIAALRHMMRQTGNDQTGETSHA